MEGGWRRRRRWEENFSGLLRAELGLVDMKKDKYKPEHLVWNISEQNKREFILLRVDSPPQYFLLHVFADFLFPTMGTDGKIYILIIMI